MATCVTVLTDVPMASAASLAGIEVNDRLRSALHFIEQHLNDSNLGIEMLLSSLCVSRPTLYRMFRTIGGVSRYIRERRLLAAYDHLRAYPDASITFLLYDLGFESERQFQRAFHTHFGMSPAQWRRICQEQTRQSINADSRRTRAC